MARLASSPKLSEYRTVGEAAAYLGVSAATLRNWDRAGKLKPRRHPQNGYRIYLHEDLEAVLRSASFSLDPSAVGDARVPIDWSDVQACDHFVQFYETDEFLTASVSGFIGSALRRGQAGVAIATAEHREQIHARLRASGVDWEAAAASGCYYALDAPELLSSFLRGEHIDARLFSKSVGSLIEKVAKTGRQIHAFGEMVSLLWMQNRRAAAIQLEELWCRLGNRFQFALFCAYPMAAFGQVADEQQLAEICECHTRVIPTESYTLLSEDNERSRAVAALQQKAQSLEAEVTHRDLVERLLVERDSEFSAFLDNASEGLCKVDPTGTITWANQAQLTLLGYAADAYIGRRISHFHIDPEVGLALEQQLKAGELLQNFPARLRANDGSIKQVLINANGYYQDDELKFSCCFTRDVTNLWLADERLHGATCRDTVRSESASSQPIDANYSNVSKGCEPVTQLPTSNMENKANSATAVQANAARRHRILVVDDNRDSADSMRTLLSIKGHDVRTANNGPDAIRLVSEYDPKIVLMDVGMPKMNGYEATQRIRQLPNGKDVYIVALTGWSQEENRRQSFEAGCSAHLVKPIDFEELDRILEHQN